MRLVSVISFFTEVCSLCLNVKTCLEFVVGTSLNTQIQRVEDKKGTLTNWNSVADPAPASAFLSAPAGMKDRFRFIIWSDLLQNKGRQVTQAHLARKVTSVKDEVQAN